jgi:UDP-glucose 6-dehydrogenase
MFHHSFPKILYVYPFYFLNDFCFSNSLPNTTLGAIGIDNAFSISRIPLTSLNKPDGSIDDSAIISNLDKLVSSAYSGIVVIKSTVLYSSIKPYFDKLRIVINPEFLSQNSFMEDAFSQVNILLGGNPSNVYKVMQLYNQDTIPEISQNPNLKFRCVTPEEAIQFKYMRNIFGAHLVTFWEWVQDQTGNARLMADLYKDFKLPSDMSQVGMDGYRGFGGACFPKDVAAWNHENNDALTTMLMEYNNGLYCQI